MRVCAPHDRIVVSRDQATGFRQPWLKTRIEYSRDGEPEELVVYGFGVGPALRQWWERRDGG